MTKKAGITEFLTKPLVKREVAETVRRALNSRSFVPSQQKKRQCRKTN
jgi:FixJ family two-component response regulator